MNRQDYILLFTPLVSGFVASAICPMNRDTAGAHLKARPPPWVFGVVWPILYLLIGLAWVRMKKSRYGHQLFGLNVALLCLWLYVYNCDRDKKGALYVIVSSLGVALATLVYSMTLDSTAGLILAPYVTWLIYATLLSFWDVSA